jgi:hypothetical protein
LNKRSIAILLVLLGSAFAPLYYRGFALTSQTFAAAYIPNELVSFDSPTPVLDPTLVRAETPPLAPSPTQSLASTRLPVKAAPTPAASERDQISLIRTNPLLPTPSRQDDMEPKADLHAPVLSAPPEVVATTLTARSTAIPVAAQRSATLLETFVNSIKNGRANELVGVYVPATFALRVKQQPPDQPDYVYPVAGYATQLRPAAQFGTVALLAHNYLASAGFFKLAVGETVTLIYGDGALKNYRISKLLRFQALRPDDPSSTFVDLDDKQRLLSSDALFRQVYMNAGTVVLQTCIAANGNSSWGRLFVIATPQ